MLEAKNTQRAIVRIGYDGSVHKTFQGPRADDRFANEVRVLKYLEARRCNFVPRLLDADPTLLKIVTTNAGARVEQISESRRKELFDELETFGVRHDDPFLRNITYRASDGRFCIIDFEFATIVGPEVANEDASGAQMRRGSAVTVVRWSGMTHAGRFRPNNEDTFLTVLLDKRGIRYLGKSGEASTRDTDFIFAVSDGMGGERSGEFASKIAIERITQLLPKQFNLPEDLFSARSREILFELFHGIHYAMTELGRFDAQCRNMGATLSLAWLRRGLMYFGHIGDSRIYRLPRAGGIFQITEDHTHVGWLRRTGKLNEREARMHPRKNVLAQALGAGHQFLAPHMGMVDFEPGDRFVLCSDGVIEGLWDRGIEELARQSTQAVENETAARTMVMTSVAECGRDNATAVVVEVF